MHKLITTIMMLALATPVLAELTIYVEEVGTNVVFSWDGIIGNSGTKFVTSSGGSADQIVPSAKQIQLADGHVNFTTAEWYAGTSYAYGSGPSFSDFIVSCNSPFHVNPDGSLRVGKIGGDAGSIYPDLATDVFTGSFSLTNTFAFYGLFDIGGLPQTLWTADSGDGSIVFRARPVPVPDSQVLLVIGGVPIVSGGRPLVSLGTVWTPAYIDTQAWWDASDEDTITDFLGEVSQWDDKSGHILNALQGVGSQQPETGTTTINGLNTLKFGPDSDALETTFNPFSGTGVVDAHVFQVMKADVTLDQGLNFSLTGNTKAAPALRWEGRAPWVGIPEGVLFEIGGNFPPQELTATNFITTSEEVMVSWYGSDTESVKEIWKNGSLFTNNTTASTVATFGNIYIGGYPTGNYQRFELGEMIILNGTVTTETRQKVEGYLAWKWGLEADLPIGHPYKDARP